MSTPWVVVGGGLAGLSTAWNLARDGEEVVVLEERKPGHPGGSSHGRARMTRSTYGSALYVELVAEALAQDWPALQAYADRPLITPTPAVFFGPPAGLFGAFSAATLGTELPGLTAVDAAEATARWPELRIESTDGVILDQTAGVISAAGALDALRRACAASGVSLRVSAGVRSIEGRADGVRLGAVSGDLIADRVVIAAGAFTGELLPELSGVIRPLRQVVGYAAPGAPEAPPVNWARLDEGLTYGLPPHEGDGAKMAGHRLQGPPDDPRGAGPTTPDHRAQLTSTLGHALRDVPELTRMETCLYGVTPTEDPVVGPLARDPRVTVCAGLSGHGFKLGPLLGRIAARVAQGRPTGVSAFDVARSRFAAERPGWPAP